MQDIDMETYGRSSSPAAGDTQVLDSNSYQQEDSGAYVHQELLDNASPEAVVEAPVERTANPQAENFRALREEVDRIKTEREAEKREYQLQIDVLRANMGQQNSPKAEPEKPMFDGMREEDVPSVAEIRKEWEQRESGYLARLEELQVQQTHPDYVEVIEKFTLPLMRQKPHLLQGLQHSSNKALTAYELGKMAQQIQNAQTPQVKSDLAQKIVDNARKPGTLSQAGGQGALSQAEHYATMSDAEFMRMANRNLEGI